MWSNRSCELRAANDAHRGDVDGDASGDSGAREDREHGASRQPRAWRRRGLAVRTRSSGRRADARSFAAGRKTTALLRRPAARRRDLERRRLALDGAGRGGAFTDDTQRAERPVRACRARILCRRRRRRRRRRPCRRDFEGGSAARGDHGQAAKLPKQRRLGRTGRPRRRRGLGGAGRFRGACSRSLAVGRPFCNSVLMTARALRKRGAARLHARAPQDGVAADGAAAGERVSVPRAAPRGLRRRRIPARGLALLGGPARAGGGTHRAAFACRWRPTGISRPAIDDDDGPSSPCAYSDAARGLTSRSTRTRPRPRPLSRLASTKTQRSTKLE